MLERQEQEQNTDKVVETRLLGAHVSEELYRQFKTAAASRGEYLKDAIEHAARMYISAGAPAKEAM